ncbi:DUF262 domain-containing protein [Rhodococcus sp. X156]|uniref:DUF262 domain-containing protein n=1 Tax=Rhodococcus sp. X156 TaxID=2499145 RepID=UPI0013E3FFC5|nr:DUF262 domain-containing protein [Rhodococcus sp. X156]
MEAHPRDLARVFHSDLRLVVPLFQRPYVWTRDSQWLPLWEDVLATKDRAADGDTVPHFMGAVVLEVKRTAHGGLEVREVIDGQQRLTTLQLLIAAVRDSFSTHGLHDAQMAKRLTKLLVNDPDLVERPEEHFRLWPTNVDRFGYRSVMTGQHLTTPYSDTVTGIVGAYTWFRTAAEQLVAGLDAEAGAAELTAVSNVLLTQLEVVLIDLGKDDNAQVIFETLNARGTPLRASDLIKNLLFRTLQDHDRPVEDLYEKYWAPLETKGWQQQVRQGRLLRPRLDAFMGYFLTVFLQREVQAHQLFPAVRAHVGNDPDRAEELLREVTRYAVVYEELDNGHAGDDLDQQRLERMEIVDTTTMTPLLLWLFANTEGVERARAVQSLESYVVRRSLARLTTKNYNRMFLELLRRLGTGAGPAGAVVTSYLAEQGSDSGMWPADDEVTRSLTTLPLYRLLKRDRLQRVLLALEMTARTARTEPVPPSRKLSVEHLLPQHWEEHWALPAALDDTEHERGRRAELLHTIGNLTLVTGSLNATLSNGSWASKRRHLLEHSALTLNRTLPEAWTTSAIEARSRYLATLAIDLWERPEPTESQLKPLSDTDRDLRPDREGNDATPARPRDAESPSTRRGDIAKHIAHVFTELETGDFLTISEIARRPSPEYADKPPSAGAISARLFPANGRMTLPGVEPGTRNGYRGAVKKP